MSNQMSIESLTSIIDIFWLISTGWAILAMQTGFCLIEYGSVGAKSAQSVIVKNVSDFAFGGIVWWLFGFGLFTGSSAFAAGNNLSAFATIQESNFGFLFQQFAFASTASTIVSGAVVGRCKFEVYIVFSTILSGIIYPIVAHWVWMPTGFLHTFGFRDWSGSGVIHLLAGAASVVAAYMVGPRAGRFVWEGKKFVKAREIKGHSVSFITLGSLFLLMAWFPFNAAGVGILTNSADPSSAARAVLNTLLAACMGIVCSVLFELKYSKQVSLPLTFNVMLLSLVGVTASCGYVDPWVGIISGFFSLPLYKFFSKHLANTLHIDDPLNASIVHGIGGAYGLLIEGIFDKHEGLIAGKYRLFVAQISGLFLILLVGLLYSAFILNFIKLFANIAYDEDDQVLGLDTKFVDKYKFPTIDNETVADYNARKRAIAKKMKMPGGIAQVDIEEVSKTWDLPTSKPIQNGNESAGESALHSVDRSATYIPSSPGMMQRKASKGQVVSDHANSARLGTDNAHSVDKSNHSFENSSQHQVVDLEMASHE